MEIKRKLGRPTNNPKNKPLHIRLDAECESILQEYCARNGVVKTEAIRRSIKLLKKEFN